MGELHLLRIQEVVRVPHSEDMLEVAGHGSSMFRALIVA
jgi:hypothetical protein